MTEDQKFEIKEHPHVRHISGKGHCVIGKDGTFVSVRYLYSRHRAGATFENICKHYGSLEISEVFSALAFAYDNREVIERELVWVREQWGLYTRSYKDNLAKSLSEVSNYLEWAAEDIYRDDTSRVDRAIEATPHMERVKEVVNASQQAFETIRVAMDDGAKIEQTGGKAERDAWERVNMRITNALMDWYSVLQGKE